MKKFFVAVAFLTAGFSLTAQTYLTRSAQVSFRIENETAKNNEVVNTLDAKTGAYNFTVLIKGFIFTKALMQEHFNEERYMGSTKFPKADFKGTIAKITKVSFKKDGIYKVEVTGDLTMHGITKKITTPGTITVAAGKVTANSIFKINRTDYGITVPDMAKDKVPEQMEITVNAAYDAVK